MAKSTRQYVFEGMELLPEALIPFVERRLAASLPGHWQIEVAQRVGLRPKAKGEVGWDQQGLLKAMISYWDYHAGELANLAPGLTDVLVTDKLRSSKSRLGGDHLTRGPIRQLFGQSAD